MLHPDFPIVEGRYQITLDWAVTLPLQFNRRIEDDSMVFWRPGITAWTVVWNNNHKQSQSERLEWLRSDIPSDAFDIESVTNGGVTRFSYRLTERRDEEVVHALYGFAIGVNGHVQLAVYFDDEVDLETVRAIFRSLEEVQTA